MLDAVKHGPEPVLNRELDQMEKLSTGNRNDTLGLLEWVPFDAGWARSTSCHCEFLVACNAHQTADLTTSTGGVSCAMLCYAGC
jgi:hypothetical protein